MNFFESYAANEDDIRISPKLKEILAKTTFAKYFKPFSQARRECHQINYNYILGKNNQGLDEWAKMHQEREELDNEELLKGSNDKEVNQAIKTTHQQVFGESPQQTIERKVMFNGVTLPIKINFLDENLITKTIYVKKPDTNRIIGHVLYNLIQNKQVTKFGFNEKMIVEAEVAGHTLLEEQDEILFVHPDYRAGIGKAAAHAEFLGMHSDVIAERNRIVDQRYNTILFDFDAILEPREKEDRGNYLMRHYSSKGIDNPQMKVDLVMVNAYREEKRNIARKISRHKRIIFEFAKEANKLHDFEYRNIKEKVQAFSGCNDLAEYITKQARIFSQ